jgi:hypothetical protein
MNRRGELLKKFPAKSQCQAFGDYYLETGSSRENTAFVLISRDGFRIKFNLDGKNIDAGSPGKKIPLTLTSV